MSSFNIYSSYYLGIFTYFGTDESGMDQLPYYQRRSRSKNIEATSWVLLAYDKSTKVTLVESLHLVKYLAKKQNSQGSFSSTQVFSKQYVICT